jgi:probable phosphoglycerate mutase
MSVSEERPLKSTCLYFARHGETDWNVARRWQGQTDVPLNATGRVQAAALAARMRAEGIRAIGSSDLARARETAEIISRELGLSVSLVDAAFRERSYGIFEGLTSSECETRFSVAWSRFEGGAGQDLPGIEPLDMLASRMLTGLWLAAERLEAPALIVSHGRSIRVLVSKVTGKDVAPIPNGGVYRIRMHLGNLVEAGFL